MIAFPTLLAKVLLFAFLILPGYFLGKCKGVERSALVSMTNILMYVAMPFLVLKNLLEIDLETISYTDILLCAVFPAVIVAISSLVAALCFRKREGDTRWRVSRFCSVYANCGFLGIPLSEVLFPEHPEIAVYVSIFNVVSTFLLLTVGVYVLSGDKRDISFRRACLSPIMAAIVLGVIILLLGGVDTGSAIWTYADILASLTTPLAMIVLGVELSGLRLSQLVKTPALYLTAAVKLVLCPLVTVLLLLVLRLCGYPLSAPLMAALFLATAVSTAASAPAMSKKYGADSELGAILTLGTTILCAVTLPILYMLFELVLIR